MIFETKNTSSIKGIICHTLEILLGILTTDPAAASRHLRTNCKDPSSQGQHHGEEAEDPATFSDWRGRANYIYIYIYKIYLSGCACW